MLKSRRLLQERTKCLRQGRIHIYCSVLGYEKHQIINLHNIFGLVRSTENIMLGNTISIHLQSETVRNFANRILRAFIQNNLISRKLSLVAPLISSLDNAALLATAAKGWIRLSTSN